MLQIVNVDVSPERRADLSGYLHRTFQTSATARTSQIEDNYRRWTDNYMGKPFEAVRTTPFYRASNFVPLLIRMHSDILSARLLGIIFGTRPFWKPRIWPALPHEELQALEKWLETVSNFDLRLFPTIDSIVNRSIKTGTTILKAPWVDHSSFIGQPGGKAIEIKNEALQLCPVPFEDFWVYPITANNLQEARIKFHRIRLTKEDVLTRRDRGLWNKQACNKLLTGGEDPITGAKQSEASQAGINLTREVSRPYNAIEAWFEYPLDGNFAKPYKLVAVFNPHTEGPDSILRLYHNYNQEGLEPFVDFRLFPREDFFYGYSVPEILEQSQEEQAQIHNTRRDASTIQNIPGWKTRRYAGVPNPSSEWYPGKTFVLENLDDLQPLQFNVTYNAMIEEESFILQLAEAYTGIGKPMQAMGSGALSGKRGIYNSMGTLAILAEGNRRLDIYLRRLRFPFHDLGNLIFQSYRDFASSDHFTKMGAQGALLRQAFQKSKNQGEIFFDISASDAGVNRETDRTSLLLMANTIAGYYRQVLQLATMGAQSPPGSPIHTIISLILEGTKDLTDRLLFAFDISDREKLTPDIAKILGGGSGQPSQPTQQGGAPATSGTISTEQLQSLSQRLATMQSGSPTGNRRM